MPWITATTAMRNPTDTMMPRSVKKERSLWLRVSRRARAMASKSGKALFVPQRFYRIELRRLRRRINTEQQSRNRGGEQRGYHRAERDVRGNGRGRGEDERDRASSDHPDHPAHERQRRGLDQELPQHLAPRGAEGLAHADF